MMVDTRTERSDWLALGLIILLAVLYLWTLPAVPFHPDEATHIYMSEDFFQLLQEPLGISWDGGLPLSPEDRYRAIDAPLSRYLIGIARGLISNPPLESDWSWSSSWKENVTAGALPSSRQLVVSRSAVSLFLLAGFWLYYLGVKQILPRPLAILALAFLGLNPLVLLHGRRALSEGILVFGIGFFLWAATRKKKNPCLIGLALALALNAKHTGAALIPVGLYAASLLPEGKISLKRTGGRIFQVLLTIGLVTAALNPFYWKHPLKAFRTGLQARASLAAEQNQDHLFALGLDRAGPLTRAGAVLVQTYISPPQTEEVGNYLPDTRQSKTQYLDNPLYTWGRGWIPGGILLIISLTGFVLMLREIPSDSRDTACKKTIWILSSLGIFLILLLPLPWQRYTVPLLPFVSFWAAAGLRPICQQFNSADSR